MPTIQSLSLRHFAASASGRICSSVRSFRKASRIALFVIDCIHMRWMGFLVPVASMM